MSTPAFCLRPGLPLRPWFSPPAVSSRPRPSCSSSSTAGLGSRVLAILIDLSCRARRSRLLPDPRPRIVLGPTRPPQPPSCLVPSPCSRDLRLPGGHGDVVAGAHARQGGGRPAGRSPRRAPRSRFRHAAIRGALGLVDSTSSPGSWPCCRSCSPGTTSAWATSRRAPSCCASGAGATTVGGGRLPPPPGYEAYTASLDVRAADTRRVRAGSLLPAPRPPAGPRGPARPCPPLANPLAGARPPAAAHDGPRGVPRACVAAAATSSATAAGGPRGARPPRPRARPVRPEARRRLRPPA